MLKLPPLEAPLRSAGSSVKTCSMHLKFDIVSGKNSADSTIHYIAC